MSGRRQARQAPYGGYYETDVPSEDAELTHVGPGTPCGEYLRRFWHPVALSSELKDLPLPIRVLGEDLILFRDRSGRVGLLHRHCAHRRASLEYGVIQERGIRCCYHGWLYDVDGTVLETPGEPLMSKIKNNIFQGAYPVLELKALIFAYLGPPEEKPGFPIYDTFELPGDELVPYSLGYPCNWLQICENSMDPVHAVFLHTRVSGSQFFPSWGELPVVEFHERKIGFFFTNARRVEDNIWIRTHDIILPNFTQSGTVLSMDGRTPRYFGRNTFTRWVVPVDDTHTVVIGWVHFNERADPPELKNTPNVIEIIEGGERRDRPYEERQRRPADYETLTGQGPISIHKKEHLASSDKGVAMLRRRLKRAIRGLKAGERPFQPAELTAPPIPTYGGDTVLIIPEDPHQADHVKILEISRRVAKVYVDADALKQHERDAFIENELRRLAQE